MPPIPDDHHAAKDLHRQFIALGKRDTRSDRSPKGTKRTATLTLATLGIVTAAAGATKVLVIDAGLIDAEPAPPRDVIRAPLDARLSPTRVADPDGGLPWGARTYISAGGQNCLVIGRVKAGRVGLVTQRGFEPLSAKAPGTCAPVSDIQIATRTYPDSTPARSVLFGLVGRNVRRVDLVIGGRTEKLPIAADGVFLKVLSGTNAFRSSTVRIVTPGKVVSRQLN